MEDSWSSDVSVISGYFRLLERLSELPTICVGCCKAKHMI